MSRHNDQLKDQVAEYKDNIKSVLVACDQNIKTCDNKEKDTSMDEHVRKLYKDVGKFCRYIKRHLEENDLSKKLEKQNAELRELTRCEYFEDAYNEAMRGIDSLKEDSKKRYRTMSREN